MRSWFMKLLQIVLLLLIVPCHTSAAEISSDPSKAVSAILILKTDTISEMQAARKILRARKISIKSIFPPSVFFVNLTAEQTAGLAPLEFIEEISSSTIDPDSFVRRDRSVVEAINFWNRALIQEKAQATSIPIVMEPFSDDLIIPTDIPNTKEEKDKKNKDYQKHWKSRKKELQDKEILPPDSEGDLVMGAPGAGGFGTATGAGYYDTSLYMAGDIAVGIFFSPGENGSWPVGEINTVFADIVSGLNRFIDDQPNAGISFTFVKEVGQSGQALPLPANERDYVNDLRNIYQTHWAYLIQVNYEAGRANANLWGPSTHLFYDTGWQLSDTARHETMHIFGAADQYCPDACQSPSGQWGYLNVVNANSKGNDGTGYFNGAGEGQPDIMISSRDQIGVYSGAQIGWRDEDGDGILDPMDTLPDITILSKDGSNPFTYTGLAMDQALLNERTYGDVSLNTIVSVDYRVNGGAWIAAEAQDGAFDSGEELFRFITPELAVGSYLIEIRATNSAGNSEQSFASDLLTIESSQVTNVTPSAAFSLSAPAAVIGTPITLDASASSDIEDNTDLLEVRWDFEDDGIWDTGYSTQKTISHIFSHVGLVTIRAEVRDTHGAVHSVTRSHNTTSVDVAPQAFFTFSPENRHGWLDPVSVTLDPTLSLDGEDALQDLLVRWDFNDDGIWDTAYSSTQSITHDFPAYRHLALNNGSTSITDGQRLFVDGNYAYVARHSAGFQIVDLSDPFTPTVVAGYDTSGYTRDLFASGSYVYLADDSGGLLILDVSKLSRPKIVGSYTDITAVYDVYVSGAYAYVTDYWTGLHIIDVSNPSRPSLVGGLNTIPSAKAIHVSYPYAYVSAREAGSAKLVIVNISDPVNPVIVGTHYTQGNTVDIDVQGNYAYLAIGSYGMEVVDISDPYMPALAATLSATESMQGIDVVGNYAFVTDSGRGLIILDVTDPVSFIYLGLYETSGSRNDVHVAGNVAYMTGYPYFEAVDVTPPFVQELAPITTKFRVKLEVMDSSGNTSQAIRDGWSVSYNEQPQLLNIEADSSHGLYLTDIGAYDTPGTAYAVNVSGSYVYVADMASGLQILDATDPVNPEFVGSYDTPGDARDVALSGTYAYVADGSYGLQIIDISVPTSPALVGNYPTQGEAHGVFIEGNRLYLADFSPGLEILDISDPANPAFLGNYITYGYGRDVYVSGTDAYLVDGYKLDIIDVSNPGQPSLKSTWDSSGGPEGVYVTGTTAYVASTSAGLEIVDVSDSANPYLLGIYGDTTWVENVVVAGEYAYITDYTSGIKILNIEDPTAPFLVNEYDTSVAHDVVFANNFLYVADHGSLQIFRSQEMPLMFLGSAADDFNISTTWDGLLEYRWDFKSDGVWDTTFSALSDISYPYDETGNTITCQVRDRFGASDRLVLEIPDHLPVAEAGPNQDSIVGQTVYFDGILSADDNGIALYEWDFQSDGIYDATGPTSSFTYMMAGSHTVTLRITDTASQTATDTLVVSVSDPGLTLVIDSAVCDGISAVTITGSNFGIYQNGISEASYTETVCTGKGKNKVCTDTTTNCLIASWGDTVISSDCGICPGFIDINTVNGSASSSVTTDGGTEPEICDDTIDNDGDSLIDCDDPDCDTFCGTQTCSDYTDESACTAAGCNWSSKKGWCR